MATQLSPAQQKELQQDLQQQQQHEEEQEQQQQQQKEQQEQQEEQQRYEDEEMLRPIEQDEQQQQQQQQYLFSDEASREEFSMETRFVVLNFLGHVSSEPSLNSSQTSSLRSTRSQASSSDESTGPEAEGERLSSHNLENLPNVCMLDKYRQSRADYQSAASEWTACAMDEEVLDFKELTSRRPAHATHEEVLKEIMARYPAATPEDVSSRHSTAIHDDLLREVASSSRHPPAMTDDVLRQITSRRPDANDHAHEELFKEIISRRHSNHASFEEVPREMGSRRMTEPCAVQITSRRPIVNDHGREELCKEIISRRHSNHASFEEVSREMGSRRMTEPRAVRPTSIRLSCSTPRREPDQESDEGSDCGSTTAHSLYSVASNTSVIDLQSDEVERLVHANALPPFVMPLREEIDWQMQQLRKGSGASCGRMGALTPESEVAYYLSLIGDQVQADYAGILGQLAQNVLSLPRERVTYSVYRHIVNELVLSSFGWTRVALLLLLAQRIIHSILSRGDRGIGGLAEYTVHLIEETSADFVVNSGGWNSVREIDSPASAVSFPQHLVTPDEVRSQVTRPTHLEAIQETDDPMSCSDSAISVNTPLSSQGGLRWRDVSNDSISSCVLNEDGSDTTDARPTRPEPVVIRTPVYSPLADNVRRDIGLLRMYSDDIALNHGDDRRWRHLGVAVAFAAIAAAVVVYSKFKR